MAASVATSTVATLRTFAYNGGGGGGCAGPSAPQFTVTPRVARRQRRPGACFWALLGDDEVGEIVVRSNQVMAGYLNNPEATAETFAHGWHHTGDLGRRDADGYYYLVDRKRDMVISGGFNIYPGEVERVLLGHPAIQDCAVIGTPDDRWGEALTAVVQLSPGASLDAEALRVWARERLSGVNTPKRYEFWEDLPRSPVGKVLKRVIREGFWQGRDRAI